MGFTAGLWRVRVYGFGFRVYGVSSKSVLQQFL